MQSPPEKVRLRIYLPPADELCLPLVSWISCVVHLLVTCACCPNAFGSFAFLPSMIFKLSVTPWSGLDGTKSTDKVISSPHRTKNNVCRTLEYHFWPVCRTDLHQASVLAPCIPNSMQNPPTCTQHYNCNRTGLEVNLGQTLLNLPETTLQLQ